MSALDGSSLSEVSMLKQARIPGPCKRHRESGRKTAIFAGSSGDWRKPTVCTTRPPGTFWDPPPQA